MVKTETQTRLKQDEGSNRISSFGPKWYTIAPSHRYIFSPALTPLVRFFANNANKVIYVWNFYDGFHSQISISLKFLENFSSSDLLRGSAGKNDDGHYEMVGSQFLNSFVGKMTNKDKVFLNNLLNQDWDWVDDYIKITKWMSSFKGTS
ncbi:MAG: hypothetical protein P4L53_05855, partial [Candidatus Obscuribacterales bacterium]|nr:hypothetical protein [Candidatus Obscuribacterales bacterium]